MSTRKSFKISDSLTKGLEETMSAAESYAGLLRVEVIPIHKIELDPTNAREMIIELSDFPQLNSKDPHIKKKLQDKESLESLAASISQEGVINPILVYKIAEGYRVVAGERRTLASKLAGKTDIPAKILDEKPSEFSLAMLQWVENIEREDLTLWERIRNLEKIISAHQENTGEVIEKKAAVIRELIRCSTTQAFAYSWVLNADSELNELIRNNQIKNLDKAAFLAKEASLSSVKPMLYDACIHGASLKELKKLLLDSKKNETTFSSPPKIKEKKDGRGKVAQRVNFGHTKNINVVQEIINAVLQNTKYNHLLPSFSDVVYSSYSDAAEAFKRLISNIESLQERK